MLGELTEKLNKIDHCNITSKIDSVINEVLSYISYVGEQTYFDGEKKHQQQIEVFNNTFNSSILYRKFSVK